MELNRGCGASNHYWLYNSRAPVTERCAVLPLVPAESTPMPRYFFHINDGTEIIDDEGSVLDDATAARAQAVATAGAMLKEQGEKFWDGTEWRMTVVDEAGQRVCMLCFSAQ